MDRVACHVIYVNRKVREERVIRANRDDVTKESLASIPPLWETDHIQDDIQPLLDAFGDGRSRVQPLDSDDALLTVPSPRMCHGCHVYIQIIRIRRGIHA